LTSASMVLRHDGELIDVVLEGTWFDDQMGYGYCLTQIDETLLRCRNTVPHAYNKFKTLGAIEFDGSIDTKHEIVFNVDSGTWVVCGRTRGRMDWVTVDVMMLDRRGVRILTSKEGINWQAENRLDPAEYQ